MLENSIAAQGEGHLTLELKADSRRLILDHANVFATYLVTQYVVRRFACRSVHTDRRCCLIPI